MPEEPVDSRSLRVSDAEREHVVGLLQRATGAGLIDLDEFGRRVDTVLAARTRGELNVVMLDLPGATHPELRPVAVSRPRRAAPAAVSHSGDAEVSSVMSTVSRRGTWTVPERLVVRAKMGSAELDFTRAHLPDVVEIELDVIAGSVEMRLPAGARIEHDRVQAVLSSIEDRTGSADVEPGGPVFVLSGAVRAGSVEVKGPRTPRWWSRGR